jgi:NAD(P)-dependent dehydrogenase (short-subunit alcohol dehydrogenase family)
MTDRKYQFAGRTAIVTGSGRGIGLAHARLLAGRGAHVVVNDLGGDVVGGRKGSQSTADLVVAEIRAAGGSAVADYSDVSESQGAQALIERALSAFGSVDILVNNAGVYNPALFETITPGQFQRTLMVHAGGHFFVTQAAWPHMVKQGRGRIVMTTSGIALYGFADACDYAAGKGAIIGLTHALSQAGAPHGIRVNAIAPVAFTRMGDGIPDPEVRKFFENNLKTDQISPVVGWLCHDECAVSGEVFDVGGGRVARVFVGETRGIFEGNLTIETVARAMPQIVDESGYLVPRDANQAAEFMTTRLGAAVKTSTA